MNQNLKARPVAIPDKGVGMMSLLDIKAGELLWTFPQDPPPQDIVKGYQPRNDSKIDDAIRDYHCGTTYDHFFALQPYVPLVFDASQLSNHSDQPNAMVVGAVVNGTAVKAMLAIRGIKEWEEIVHDFFLSCGDILQTFIQRKGLQPTKRAWAGKLQFFVKDGKRNKKYTVEIDQPDFYQYVMVRVDDKKPLVGVGDNELPFITYPFSMLPANQALWYYDDESGWVKATKVG